MATATSPAPAAAPPAPGTPDEGRYRWTVLSNTTLGVFMAALDSSIVLISLPAIFRGIHLDPLQPSNISYLLWMLMGYLVVTAVLVVTFGRLGDIYGRVRMYNAGFAVFTLASILLSLTPFAGSSGALWLIGFRVVQGVGGALLMANSAAIITDAFPAERRGFAMGVNMIAMIAGSFVGLIVGGLLADIDWRLVFWVNVPFGIFGTVWAYARLREVGTRRAARLDWWGNVTFAAGLILVLVGITYGLQPYNGHAMGWTSPSVLAALLVGAALLGLFCWIETRVEDPMFDLRLFKIRAFTAGNAAGFLASMSRGGLQFMLIIWLQGIWLPLHGYSFIDTPLWAGIYMLPLTGGFLIAGPLAGWLSDRYGARAFATIGMLLAALSFGLLMFLPANFSFPIFAALLALNGIGTGMFAAPNTTAIMNSVPAEQRGAASGMRATFMNTGSVVSIGLFFSLMIVGLASTLPTTLANGLRANGVPAATAHHIASLPPVGTLFAAFLGYNPIQRLLGPQVLSHLSAAHAANLTGKSFFPHLISGPFMNGLTIVFSASMLMAVIAAGASLMRGANYVHVDARGEIEADDDARNDSGRERVGPFGAPLGDGPEVGDRTPVVEEWTPA
jgi:EmrB/QacA subfamily drug resistance transporter